MLKTIKFNPQFIPLILSGRKTQTRRPVKPQPEKNCDSPYNHNGISRICPYGKNGDLLQIEDPNNTNNVLIEVTNTFIEPLKDITHHDAIAEGCNPHPDNPYMSVNGDIEKLWNEIYGETEFKWENSPWVWVIEFKVIGRLTLL